MPVDALTPILPPYIDSTMVSAFRSCPRKFYNEFILGLRPSGISIDLHAGGAFAHALEVVRNEIFVNHRPMNEALLRASAAFEIYWGDFVVPEHKKTNKRPDRVWAAVEDYFAKYPPLTDHIQPYFIAGKPTFEFTFAIPLDGDNPTQPWPRHPISGEPFIYSGRFDMLGEYLGMPIVEDDKTAGTGFYSGWSEKWDLRSQFIGYCVSPDTEVLTHQGWIPINTLNDGVAVAQWDKGKISFVVPSKITREHFQGQMTSVDGRVQLLATPNHRQLYFDSYDKKYKESQIKNFPWSRGAARFITGGMRIDGISVPKAFIQLLVATQADGHLLRDSNGIRFGFKKSRKIVRMASILKELNIPHTTNIQTDGRTVFHLSASRETTLIRTYLGESKNFDSWLLQWNGESLHTFINELKHWDGTDYNTKILYSTNNKTCADWVETIAPLCGYYTSRQIKPATGSRHEHYRITISTEIHKSVLNHDVVNIPWNNMVYCVTVPSSYFLIRYKGKTLVTGNTWACQQLGIAVDSVAVRGIGIQMTQISHAEAIKPYSNHLRALWLEQLRRDLWRLVTAWNEGYFDYNFGESCNAYGNCMFIQPCQSLDPEPWLKTFDVRRWNPIAQDPTKEPPNVPI